MNADLKSLKEELSWILGIDTEIKYIVEMTLLNIFGISKVNKDVRISRDF